MTYMKVCVKINDGAETIYTSIADAKNFLKSLMTESMADWFFNMGMIKRNFSTVLDNGVAVTIRRAYFDDFEATRENALFL